MAGRYSVRPAVLGALLVTASVGCTGQPSSPQGGGGSDSATAATITISNNTVSPANVTIQAGQRVLFINNDNHTHNMTSDPHPEHDQCPEINQVGFLLPGQRRETGNFVTPETCGFHDHDANEIQSLWGHITIQ